MEDLILVRFERDFDWIERTQTTAYKAGMLISIPYAVADVALDQGAAVQVDEDPIFDPAYDEDDAD